MATLQELALDQKLTARVIAAERRHELHERAAGDALADEDGLVSPGARRRDALYRRSLIAADILATAGALTFAIVAVGGSALRPGLVAAVPVVVLLGKLLGLYDRDENVFHKSTLDEAPK